MTPEIIAWLFPAYIISLFHRQIASHRNQSGWDLIIRYGFTSTVIYIVSVIFKLCIHSLFQNNFFYLFLDERYSLITRKFAASPSLALLPIGIFLSILYGLCILKIKSCHSLFCSLYHKINPLDPFMSFTREIIMREGYILISLKSGKVYVGQLINATFDVNENTKVITIAIDFSGYRKSEDKSVVFDKNYTLVETNPKLREVLIPFSEISSLAPFDFEIHKKFVELGITKLGYQKN